MGQEIECRIRHREQSLDGRAYLETDHLLFRDGTVRLKVLFKDMNKVEAGAGILRLDFEGGPAELELGAAAEKWADKILHPPSRMHKLGVKPGMTVRVVGKFDEDFIADLAASHVTPADENLDLVFLAAPGKTQLQRMHKLAAKLAPDGAIWVVYPRGIERVREIDVIHAGRAADLKDVKVASFSLTHTALKFMIPRIHRRKPR